jgi:hypothetical protein
LYSTRSLIGELPLEELSQSLADSLQTCAHFYLKGKQHDDNVSEISRLIGYDLITEDRQSIYSITIKQAKVRLASLFMSLIDCEYVIPSDVPKESWNSALRIIALIMSAFDVLI